MTMLLPFNELMPARTKRLCSKHCSLYRQTVGCSFQFVKK
jgi:hypothetical protein